jgi:hypothetical protein
MVAAGVGVFLLFVDPHLQTGRFEHSQMGWVY